MDILNGQTPKRKVAIYIRVSTPEQKQDGYSPEHQRKRLLAYINDNKGLNLTTDESLVFEDVGTGSNLNRPALDKIRELVKKKKIQGVLVWKIDRLSRNLKHLLVLFEEMQKHEVSFISIQENIDFTGPIGRLIFQMFGAIAQFERELIRGRTYAGKLASAEQGNYTGTGIPYGYKKTTSPSGKGSTLVLNSKEKCWVEQIYDWYVYEKIGDYKIANKLNELKTPYGSKKVSVRANLWTEKKVRQILKNPIYFGKHIAIKKDEEGRILPPDQQTVAWFPPCISEVLFMQAQRARANRVGGFSKNAYLLSGKLFDISPELPEARKMCGAKRTKGGFSYRRKLFKDHTTDTTYSNFEIPAKQLEAFVWGKILTAFKDPAAFVKKYVQLNKQGDKTVENIELQLRSLRKRETEIQEIEVPNSEKALLRGVFSEEQFKKVSIDYDEELTQIAEKAQRLEEDLQGLVWVKSEITNLKVASKSVIKKVEGLDYEQKRILCDLFVEKIEITKTEIPKQKRQVRADIYFRFNLSRLTEDLEVGCTPTSQSGTTKTPSEEGLTSLSGERGRSGYLPIRLSANSSKSLEIRHQGLHQYAHQELNWAEEKGL